MQIKNPTWPWLTSFVILTCALISRADEIEDAESALKKKDPAAAVEVLTDAVIANADEVDYARYLRATALFRAKQFAESVQDCDAIGEDSDWFRKAIFLKAENLIAQKQHAAVEEIYRAETARIFAEERKERLARLLIDFADELSEAAANEEFVSDEKASKAITLLDKAAELKVGAQLKEEIAYKKVILLRDGEPNPLQTACNAYLAFHDPEWRKPLGRGAYVDEFKPAEDAGQHVWEVRMILFESVHAEYGADTRRYANRVLADAPNAGDVEWLIAKSYRGDYRGVRVQGAAPKPDDPERLQAFLDKFPNHSRAAEAAILRAQALEDDEKIAAFEAFLDRENWPAPIVDRGDKREPSALLNEWREFASFGIGFTKFMQNDFAGAIEQWQTYSRDFANGSLWARAQALMVTAEFKACLIPVDEEDEERARELFAAFMTKYPLDRRVPQLLYLLGEFPFAAAAKLLEDDAAEDQWKPLCEKAIAEWSTLIAKYPNTYEANLALYRTGALQSGPLEQFEVGLETLRKVTKEGQTVTLQGRGDVLINGNIRGNVFVGGGYQGEDVQFHARNGNPMGQVIASGGNRGNITVNAGWSDSSQIEKLAKERVDLLESKSLALSTERIFRTNEPATVSLQVRNIDKVEFSRYTLDLERYFRSHHRFDTEKGIESLDIDLIQPDETWTFEVDDFAEHKLHDLEVDARFAAAEPGVCIIRAEAEGWQASTVVLRSNIDLITQATWREGLVFAQDSMTNQPIAGARVLVTNRKELIGEGETNEQGVFQLQGQMIRDSADLNFYVHADQGEAIKRLNLTGMTQEITGGYTEDEYAMLSKKGFLYTSKEEYRPGQTVHLRGILRDVLEGSYVVPENKEIIVTLNDPNGRTAREWTLTLNDFGTFELDFDLPAKARGYFVLTAKPDEADAEVYARQFYVNQPVQYSEAHFKFTFDSRSVLTGEVICGKVAVTQPWGDPIVDELVRLELPGQPDQELKTDERGEIAFEIPTAEIRTGVHRFEAELVHLSGDGYAVAYVHPAAFRLEMKDLPASRLAGQPMKFRAKTLDGVGDPVAQTLQYKIEKMPAAAGHTVLSGLPTISFQRQAVEPETVLEREVNSDAETGLAELEATLENPGHYRIIISGTDAAGNEVRESQEFRVDGDADDSKLHIFADESSIAEGATLKLSIHSQLDSPLALLTLGGATVLETRPIELNEGHNELEIPVQAEHWPKFDVSVAFLHEGKLQRARQTFEVERELKIEIIAPDGPRTPGTEAAFAVRTTNALGEPVAAELSLGLSGRLADQDHGFMQMFRRGQRPGASFRSGSTGIFKHVARSRFADPDGDSNDTPQYTRNHRERVRQLLQSEHGLCAEIPTTSDRLDDKRGAFEMPRLFANDSPDFRWSGAVETDANGRGEITLTLPDSIGDWALGAVGVDRGRLLGQAQMSMETRRPIELSLIQPTDLRSGDVWRPEVWVTNHENEAQTVNVVSQAGEMSVTREVALQPGLKMRVTFEPVEVGTVGPLSWNVSVGEFGKNAEIPVRPSNVMSEGASAVVVSGQAGSIQLENPAAAEIAASFYAKPEDFLVDLALGNTPQITGLDRESQTEASQLLAATSALRLARARNLDVPELERRIETLILALQVTERDSGWTWQGVNWGRGSLTTSLGLWGLREAKDLGFYVNDDLIKDGVEFVKSVLAVIPPEEPEKSAMTLFALSLESAENFSIANRLYRDRETLNPAALAFLAGTFLRMDRPVEANEILEVLLEKAEDDTWPGSEIVARMSQSGDISAMALWALAKAGSPDATRIANALLKRGGAQFGQESAMQGLWVAALSEYYHKQPAAAESEIRLTLAGEEWAPSDHKFADPNAEVNYTAANGILLFSWASNEGNPASTDGDRSLLPKIVSREYFPTNLRFEDRYISSKSTSPIRNIELGQIIRVKTTFEGPEDPYLSFIQIEEPIPAGFVLVPNFLRVENAKVEQVGNVVRITGLPHWQSDIEYRIAAVRPGEFQIPPTIIRDECRPDRFLVGEASALSVLPLGQESQDNYELNSNERYELAKLHFKANQYDEALEHLEAIENESNRSQERDISRMLLWIHASRDEVDARRIVERFEALSERHADLVIPFDKIHKVAQAYKALGELERSWLVYRAMIESNFINDASVAMQLKANGDLLGYRDTQLDLWKLYPNASDALLAYLALAQDLEENSKDIDSLELRKEQTKPTKGALLEQSRDLLERYLTLYTEDEQADAAAFSLANVYFDLKDYQKVASRSEAAALTYPESDFKSSFQYMAALGYFWQYQFPNALQAAQPVADGRTENAASARYIIAQVHQAQGNPVQAIEWYEKVRNEFGDAADSLEYLDEKGVKLPDAVSFHPGEDVNVELSYRNIKEADIQVYKVDLMRLYSRQKDLANMSLAGISPEAELRVELGEGADYEWKKRALQLPIDDEGAYLLVCRGDSSFASGMVLVTPLEFQVREEMGSGEMRIHLWDNVRQGYVADAEIKSFDSGSSGVQTGRTDPRGVFHVSGVRGYSTVIVKHEETRYGYYRSTTPLSRMQVVVDQQEVEQTPKPARMQPGKELYFRQLKGRLKEGADEQKAIWSEKLEKGGKGVKASKAYKK